MRITTTRLYLALAMAACALASGCSGAPEEDAPDYVVGEDDVTANEPPRATEETAPVEELASAEAPNLDPTQNAASLVESQRYVDAPEDMASAEQSPEATAETAPAPTAPVEKSGTCTSRYGSHSSVAKLTWVVSGKNAVMKSLMMTVKNVYGRHANDVDVYVDTPTAAEYKSFNSGDILRSGTTRTVRLPANWTKPLNTRIRLLTNFDQEGYDPYASCSITLTGS